jgi:hypothetical protein
MSSEDSPLTPDPQSSSLGDLTDLIRSRAHDIGEFVGDFGRRLNTRDTINIGGSSSSTRRRGKRAEQIEPPRDAYSKFRNQYDTTPLISSPIDQMASDTTADGWRVQADDDRTQEFLGQWGKQCAIIAGETGKDFIELVDVWSKVFDIYGTPITENVPALQRPDAVAALKMVPPGTISYQTRPGSSMLLRKQDTQYANKLTGRNTAAAYVQYDRDADEIWTDGQGRRLEERRFDVDQLTRAVRNPDPGGVTGKSAVEQISEQTETMKEMMRNDEVAVESSAWKQLFIGFKPLVESLPNGVEITELSETGKDRVESHIETAEPGEVVTYDAGSMEVHDVSGEVADLVGRYEFFVEYILSAMPAPKFMAGFADNLNRDIASDQAAAHEQAVKQRKQLISRTFTPVFKRVADQHAYPTDGVEITLEPPTETSPVLSLTDEEMTRLKEYSTALKNIAGGSPPAALVNEEQLLDLVLQLDPEEAALTTDEEPVDESDEETVRQFNALMNAGESGE